MSSRRAPAREPKSSGASSGRGRSSSTGRAGGRGPSSSASASSPSQSYRLHRSRVGAIYATAPADRQKKKASDKTSGNGNGSSSSSSSKRGKKKKKKKKKDRHAHHRHHREGSGKDKESSSSSSSAVFHATAADEKHSDSDVGGGGTQAAAPKFRIRVDVPGRPGGGLSESAGGANVKNNSSGGEEKTSAAMWTHVEAGDFAGEALALLVADHTSKQAQHGQLPKAQLQASETTLRKLSQTLRMLWHACNIPQWERMMFVKQQLRARIDSYETIVSLLLREIKHLQRFRQVIQAVEKAIEHRENVRALIHSYVAEYLPEQFRGGSFVATGLMLPDLLVTLRDASVAVVESIVRWRRMLLCPRGYAWQGQPNYLLKMQRDLQFLFTKANVKWLEHRDVQRRIQPLDASGILFYPVASANQLRQFIDGREQNSSAHETRGHAGKVGDAAPQDAADREKQRRNDRALRILRREQQLCKQIAEIEVMSKGQPKLPTLNYNDDLLTHNEADSLDSESDSEEDADNAQAAVAGNRDDVATLPSEGIVVGCRGVLTNTNEYVGCVVSLIKGSSTASSQLPEKKLELHVNDIVEANCGAQGVFYAGRIHECRADGTYDVAYDDGDFEEAVPIQHIRLVRTEGDDKSRADVRERTSTQHDGDEQRQEQPQRAPGTGHWTDGLWLTVAVHRPARQFKSHSAYWAGKSDVANGQKNDSASFRVCLALKKLVDFWEVEEAQRGASTSGRESVGPPAPLADPRRFWSTALDRLYVEQLPAGSGASAVPDPEHVLLAENVEAALRGGKSATVQAGTSHPTAGHGAWHSLALSSIDTSPASTFEGNDYGNNKHLVAASPPRQQPHDQGVPPSTSSPALFRVGFYEPPVRCQLRVRSLDFALEAPVTARQAALLLHAPGGIRRAIDDRSLSQLSDSLFLRLVRFQRRAPGVLGAKATSPSQAHEKKLRSISGRALDAARADERSLRVIVDNLRGVGPPLVVATQLLEEREGDLGSSRPPSAFGSGPAPSAASASTSKAKKPAGEKRKKHPKAAATGKDLVGQESEPAHKIAVLQLRLEWPPLRPNFLLDPKYEYEFQLCSRDREAAMRIRERRDGHGGGAFYDAYDSSGRRRHDPPPYEANGPPILRRFWLREVPSQSRLRVAARVMGIDNGSDDDPAVGTSVLTDSQRQSESVPLDPHRAFVTMTYLEHDAATPTDIARLEVGFADPSVPRSQSIPDETAHLASQDARHEDDDDDDDGDGDNNDDADELETTGTGSQAGAEMTEEEQQKYEAAREARRKQRRDVMAARARERLEATQLQRQRDIEQKIAEMERGENRALTAEERKRRKLHQWMEKERKRAAKEKKARAKQQAEERARLEAKKREAAEKAEEKGRRSAEAEKAARLQSALDKRLVDLCQTDSAGVFYTDYHTQRQGVGVLVSSGANPNASDEAGLSALTIAAIRGRVAVVESLLQHGASLQGATNSGSRTSASGQAPPPDSKGKWKKKSKGSSADSSMSWALKNGGPLMLAAGLGYADVVEVLLENATVAASTAPNARAAAPTVVNARRTLDGMTPLAAAASQGHAAVVRQLLSAGADPLQTLHNGTAPLQLAATPAIQTLLNDAGASHAASLQKEAAATATAISGGMVSSREEDDALFAARELSQRFAEFLSELNAAYPPSLEPVRYETVRSSPAETGIDNEEDRNQQRDVSAEQIGVQKMTHAVLRHVLSGASANENSREQAQDDESSKERTEVVPAVDGEKSITSSANKNGEKPFASDDAAAAAIQSKFREASQRKRTARREEARARALAAVGVSATGAHKNPSFRVAEYDYDANDDDELTIREGDIVVCIDADEDHVDDWFDARKYPALLQDDGAGGSELPPWRLTPKAYVRPLTALEADELFLQGTPTRFDVSGAENPRADGGASDGVATEQKDQQQAIDSGHGADQSEHDARSSPSPAVDAAGSPESWNVLHEVKGLQKTSTGRYVKLENSEGQADNEDMEAGEQSENNRKDDNKRQDSGHHGEASEHDFDGQQQQEEEEKQHEQQHVQPQFQVGDAVKVDYQGHGAWYDASIEVVLEDGTYTVSYSDGHQETAVPADRIWYASAWDEPGSPKAMSPSSSALSFAAPQNQDAAQAQPANVVDQPVQGGEQGGNELTEAQLLLQKYSPSDEPAWVVEMATSLQREFRKHRARKILRQSHYHDGKVSFLEDPHVAELASGIDMGMLSEQAKVAWCWDNHAVMSFTVRSPNSRESNNVDGSADDGSPNSSKKGKKGLGMKVRMPQTIVLEYGGVSVRVNDPFLVVEALEDDSPLHGCGIEAGDAILTVDGCDFRSLDEFGALVHADRGGGGGGGGGGGDGAADMVWEVARLSSAPADNEEEVQRVKNAVLMRITHEWKIRAAWDEAHPEYAGDAQAQAAAYDARRPKLAASKALALESLRGFLDLQRIATQEHWDVESGTTGGGGSAEVVVGAAIPPPAVLSHVVTALEERGDLKSTRKRVGQYTAPLSPEEWLGERMGKWRARVIQGRAADPPEEPGPSPYFRRMHEAYAAWWYHS